MLISRLVEDTKTYSDDDDADLYRMARDVVDRLQSTRPNHPMIVSGLEQELVTLFKRMCHPLKMAIERSYSELATTGLAQWIKSQLGRCPILDKALHEQSRQLIEEFIVFEHRYLIDRLELAAKVLRISDAKLISVRIASADKHHGQHVLKLEFSDLPAVYYKPRSGDGATLLKKVSHVLPSWGLRLMAADVLARDGYHWMAEVPYQASLDAESARQFAFSGGVLYSLANAFNASDLHFENIIASSEGPVVVDCETICQPRFSEPAAAYLLKRPREEHDDVTSLFFNFDHFGGQDIDYGGLSCVDFLYRADPNAGLQIALSSEQRQVVQHRSRSAMEVEGRRIAPAVEYFDSFADGIRHASWAIKEHKCELLALISPESTFRVPLRATRVYAALLMERLTAICFSSYASSAWSAHIKEDLEHCAQDFLPAAQSIVEQETIELNALDIPVAYVRAGSRDLLLRDTVISGVFDLSPLEVVRRRLEKLSDVVTNEQISILNARLTNAVESQ